MARSYTTFVLTAAPPNLRHALTRWLIEPAPGVFVGNISAKVRERLWSEIQNAIEQGWGLMIASAPVEQGYHIDICGTERRTIITIDDLQLVATPFDNQTEHPYTKTPAQKGCAPRKRG